MVKDAFNFLFCFLPFVHSMSEFTGKCPCGIETLTKLDKLKRFDWNKKPLTDTKP